jgi:hypothetical protein
MCGTEPTGEPAQAKIFSETPSEKPAMFQSAGAHFGPDEIAAMDAALSAAWASLPADRQTEAGRLAMAQRILKAAVRGERDPMRLHAAALIESTETAA